MTSRRWSPARRSISPRGRACRRSTAPGSRSRRRRCASTATPRASWRAPVRCARRWIRWASRSGGSTRRDGGPAVRRGRVAGDARRRDRPDHPRRGSTRWRGAWRPRRTAGERMGCPVPGMSTLLVPFDVRAWSGEAASARLMRLLEEPPDDALPAPTTTHRVPVRYGGARRPGPGRCRTAPRAHASSGSSRSMRR